MDEVDGVKIVLFPGDVFPGGVETHVDIHADVDRSIPVSIISRPVLNCLRLDCKPCEAIDIQYKRQQKHRLFGKVDLQWHIMGIAKQHSETFYIIESETKMVVLGRTAFPEDEDQAGAGTYPLEHAKQTSEEAAQQAQKKIGAKERQAEEKKQQEARDREKWDREKRQAQGSG
ncbi:MAG: hypothetical protein Q9225_004881 [Loekoesia sp. 1 TL-2023]